MGQMSRGNPELESHRPENPCSFSVVYKAL